MGQKTFDKIMYTLTGCPACSDLKEELKRKITTGEIDIRECNLNSKDPKTINICQEAMDQPNFDGFPSVYDLKGNKVF